MGAVARATSLTAPQEVLGLLHHIAARPARGRRLRIVLGAGHGGRSGGRERYC